MEDDPLSSLPLPDNFTLFDDDTFDITFDDLNLPSDTEEFLNSTVHRSNLLDLPCNDHLFHDFVSNCCSVNCNGNCNGNCYGNCNGDCNGDCNGNCNGSNGSDVSGFLNIPSPEGSSGEGSGEESRKSVRVLENMLTDSRDENPVSSQGSGNCGSDGSEGANNNSMSCASPESGNSVVEQKVKRERERERERNEDVVLKRKNESSDVNSELRTVKYRRSNEASGTTEDLERVDGMDEKKKARLIRNRESAQLSRQRKKHYVEELEDKVKAMHATIQDLNARISYFAAENATLKQQMVGGGGVGAPPVMYPPHPAMGPMGYPWMPCPPYVVKSQGSQVPLVPIPRLKPQQLASSSQKVKKVEVKKAAEGMSKSKSKTKKVAGISFIGLLLFILLFGGLVPIMNVKLGGGVKNSGYSGKGSEYKMYNHGRVLMGDDYLNGTDGKSRNASEPLVASLYVPRNDKLVKIDGNLIIHSVLASEKAMASREEEEGMGKKDDIGLAVSQDLVPAIPAVNRNGGRQPHVYRTSSDHQRALASDKEKVKSKHADGKLQQWFREGLAGPMLSSGMCTEVFQFDVSAAIVPATSVVNITATENHNSTYISTMKNRRILHGLPIPLSTSATNITKEQVSSATEAGGHDSNHNEPHHKNNSVSPMVVSVLFDPREAGDGGDVDGGMMGGGAGGAKGKSFSRIFVVVLLDSVKYVTYSCMLPLKGAGHLVTA